MNLPKIFSEAQIKSVVDVWHPTKNLPLKVVDVSLGSARKVWFMCELGHDWEASVNSRTGVRVRGCPYCANRKILEGFNDLGTVCSELVKEWHPTKNGELTPYNVGGGSHAKVWWQCGEGHEWEAVVRERFKSREKICPTCRGRKVLAGFNDLSTIRPATAFEWHPIKNGKLTPEQVSKSSNKKVWWLGECGHEWETTINNRSRKNSGGCPYCSNFLTLAGFNDLATTHPELIKEWNYQKQTILPVQFTAGSDTKVWWLCEKGHEWEAYIYNRTARSPRGCPKCSNNSTSKDERKLLGFVQKTLGLEAVGNTKKIIPPHELDIFVPEKNVAIEFNGLYWHSERTKPRNYHYMKWLACKEAGVQLIQIWEDDWVRNPELVERMLAYKLNVSSGDKVFGRKTVVSSLTKDEASSFLLENHIQGAAHGSIRVGLQTGTGELVAVMVLKVEPQSDEKVLNLVRYATSKTVVGGFTKLLSWVEKKYSTIERVVTFSDNTISDGGLYENNGFIATKELKPDYMYIQDRVRYHKFGYRLKRFRVDPELQYVEGYTERQLAELNGLERVWDAGKTKWEKEVSRG